MSYKYVSVLFLGLAAVLGGSYAFARTVSLNELTQLLVKKNPDLISSRADIEQAQIEERGVARLSTSTFSAATNYYDIDILDRATPADLDQQRTQFDLGLTGRSQRWGLGYNFTYTHSQQVQESFETVQRVTKDGQEIKLGFEYDLLRNSSSVGKLPFDVAAQRTRLASVQQKSVYQSLLRDLFGRYLAAMLLQQKIENAQALLLETEELNKHYKTLYAEGRLSKVEFLSSEIQISSSRAVISRLKSESKLALRELVTFAGGLEDSSAGEDLQLKPLSLDYITAEKVNSQRSNNERPGNFEIQTLDLQRKVADLESAELKDKLRPDLKIVGGRSWLKNPPAESFMTEDDIKVDQWYVGLKLEVPLDKIGPKSDLAVKRVQATNLDTRRRLLVNTNELRIQNLFEELAALDAQLKSTEELEKLETERFKATIPLVERSSSARLDIFDFQNRIRDHRAQLVETRVEILRRRAEVLYLSGVPLLR